jgi:isopentenyl diphosphate isomerase/L-lactate dehydrogenase-like FMN-dependent dehydrogenase
LEHAYGLDAIAAGNHGGVAIVKPLAQPDIIAFFRRAEQCGATAVGVDVDGFNSFMMNAHGKPVFRKTQEELRELVHATRLPVVAKGVMCPEDAVAAAEAGVAVVVVSNHGGRVLDHTPGTADVLPEVAAALRGGRVALVADGGVRTGYDVLKMLALGAGAVLVGRDIVRAAVGGGSEGVRLQMTYLQKTLAKAMKMTGCSTLADIGPQVLAPYRAEVFPA